MRITEEDVSYTGFIMNVYILCGLISNLDGCTYCNIFSTEIRTRVGVLEIYSLISLRRKIYFPDLLSRNDDVIPIVDIRIAQKRKSGFESCEACDWLNSNMACFP